MVSRIGKKVLCVAVAASLVVAAFVPAKDAQIEAKAKAKLKTKSISVEIGKKKTIVIKNKDSKCRYSFVAKNKKIATVTKKGVVKGKKKGTTKITVKQTVKKTKKTKKLGTVKVKVISKKIVDVTPAPTATINVVQPTAVPTATPVPTACVNIDFSNKDISMFGAEGDGVKIELSDNGYYDETCLKATNRGNRNDWFGCGMSLNLSNYIEPGKLYSITCYVKSAKDATITLKTKRNTGGFSFPSQVGEQIKVKAETWTEFKATYASPDSDVKGVIIFWDASNTADLYLDSIEIIESPGMDSTFKDTFTEIFENVGTCNNYSQMRDNKLFTTSLFNSVTMENEMKPQHIINGAKISNQVPEGYVVPSSYQDNVYPEFNFSSIDNVINTAYEYGLRIRFHVLVWHSQTPSYFFKHGYDDTRSMVNTRIMDGRLEYYITNVMKHIYETPHGKDVVYAWDVVNEYFHNYDQGSKSMWNTIYYPEEKVEADRTNKPVYVKQAFQIAHKMLEEYGLQDSVSLFYNDYNTYEVTEQIVEMINYVNEEGKICDGVGMQSHLDVDYPTPMKIASTIDEFTKNGYEIQITELDVTDYDNSGKQTQYYCDLIKMFIEKKKAGSNITGLTFWGLSDANSWRSSGKPLLFSAIFSPKDVFYKVIETAQNAWK